jgi:hypothetical protein
VPLLIVSSCGCCWFIAFTRGAIVDGDDKDLLPRLLTGATVPPAPFDAETLLLLFVDAVVIDVVCGVGVFLSQNTPNVVLSFT